MKPRIFIGASHHGHEAAARINKYLSARFSIDDANDALHIDQRYDFAILIVMKNDLPSDHMLQRSAAFIRNTIAGRLYVLVQEGTTGTERFFINADEHTRMLEFVSTSENEMEHLAQCIEDRIVAGEEVLLPSTALAISYYYDFVTTFCDYFSSTDELLSDRNKVRGFKLNVIVPFQLGADESTTRESHYRKYISNPVPIPLSGGRMQVMADADTRSSEVLQLYHLPPSLYDIDKSIDHYKSRGKIAAGITEKLLEERELTNFQITLQNLVDGDALIREVVRVVREEK